MPSLVTEVETQKYLGRALLETARAGHLEISKYLISEGADVNLQDEEYGTPLYYAAMHLDLVQFLLASGADPNIHNEPFVPLFNASNIDVAEVLLLSGANLHAEDDERRNVLSHVTDIEMLRFFLERGVDPNHEDGLGGTPLHEACRHGTAWVELLLQFGVTMVEKKNWNRRTPVDIAMAMGSPDVVNMLEPLVQDPNLKSKIATWWERKGVIRR
ncbi:ankyrin repeat-containing domain protein [Mycena galopus ATCC 62051]|nr:ankyrin repeat-containing domain protein [Mycena galopus ATCC 62051]